MKGGVKLTPPPGKTTFKKPSLIRVNSFSNILAIKKTVFGFRTTYFKLKF